MDREAYMEEGQGYEIIQPGTGDLVEGDAGSYQAVIPYSWLAPEIYKGEGTLQEGRLCQYL